MNMPEYSIFPFRTMCEIENSLDNILSSSLYVYPDYFYGFLFKYFEYCKYNEKIKLINSFNYLNSDDKFKLKISYDLNQYKIIILVDDKFIDYDINLKFNSNLNRICIFLIPVIENRRHYGKDILCFQKVLSKKVVENKEIYDILYKLQFYDYGFYMRFLLSFSKNLLA